MRQIKINQLIVCFICDPFLLTPFTFVSKSTRSSKKEYHHLSYFYTQVQCGKIGGNSVFSFYLDVFKMANSQHNVLCGTHYSHDRSTALPRALTPNSINLESVLELFKSTFPQTLNSQQFQQNKIIFTFWLDQFCDVVECHRAATTFYLQGGKTGIHKTAQVKWPI